MRELSPRAGIAFDPINANFKGINDDKKEGSLYIKDIFHEAVVKIYEEGTTAAATTAIISAPGSTAPIEAPPEKIVNFHAIRPFFFFILHQPSQTILFMGRVDEPETSDGQ